MNTAQPKRKRAPGGGRKPLPPGEHLIQMTVRLSAEDMQYLQQLDSNISAAVRTIIHERKEQTVITKQLAAQYAAEDAAKAAEIAEMSRSTAEAVAHGKYAAEAAADAAFDTAKAERLAKHAAYLAAVAAAE